MRYAIADRVLHQEFPDETVLLNLTSAEYFSLNDLGLAVWRLLRAGVDREGLEAVLLRDYDASPEQVRRDVQGFLDRLLELHLIREVAE
jgi:hypothetical protein